MPEEFRMNSFLGEGYTLPEHEFEIFHRSPLRKAPSALKDSESFDSKVNR